MKKRAYLIRIIKGFALLLPIAAVVLFLQNSLFGYSDEQTERIRGFYREPANSLDVVILGASEVYSGFSPVYAYSLEGFTSYPYVFGANPGSLYLAELKEVLSRQNPQFILVEPQGFIYDDDFLEQENHLRTFCENIPKSWNWFESICEHAYKDKLSCFFPFFKYHGQWQLPFSELKKHYLLSDDKDQKPLWLKGATADTGTDQRIPERDLISDDTVNELSPLGEKSLIAFLDYCKENQLDNVIFIKFPHKVLTESQYHRFARSNRVLQIAEQYGYLVVNLEKNLDEAGFDFEYDFDDPEHLNFYGQARMTEYICDLLCNEYGLQPMPQLPENRRHWEDALRYHEALTEAVDERFEEEKNENLSENAELLKELEERISRWDESADL